MYGLLSRARRTILAVVLPVLRHWAQSPLAARLHWCTNGVGPFVHGDLAHRLSSPQESTSALLVRKRHWGTRATLGNASAGLTLTCESTFSATLTSVSGSLACGPHTSDENRAAGVGWPPNTADLDVCAMGCGAAPRIGAASSAEAAGWHSSHD